MTDKEIKKAVGKFCKKFRVNYLEISMTDFADKTGLSVQNINAFEGGRSSNMKYLFYYHNFADTQELKDVFIHNLFTIQPNRKGDL